MALGDIKLYNAGPFGEVGSVQHQVVSGGTPPAINAGEPVAKTLGNQYVTAMATSKPVQGTDFMAGIAQTTSSETASANGTVQVIPFMPGQIWLIKPKTVATYFGSGYPSNPSQSTYNALVGTRVTIDLTSGSYTLNASDSATNGVIVENLDITKFPGVVAISFRLPLMYTIGTTSN